MTTNDIIRDSRVAHVRTLKAELARVTAARDAARQQVAAWEHHFALAVLAARNVVKPGGLFIAEMKHRQAPDVSPAWEVCRDRVYGQTRLVVYRRLEATA